MFFLIGLARSRERERLGHDGPLGDLYAMVGWDCILGVARSCSG